MASLLPDCDYVNDYYYHRYHESVFRKTDFITTAITTSRGGPPLPKTKFKNDREWRGGALWQECRAAVAFL